MKLFPAKCHERATLRKLWRQTGNSWLLPPKCWPLLQMIRVCSWRWPDVVAGISARFSKFAFVLFCHITNHLMTVPLGNSEFWLQGISMFPETKLRETLRQWHTHCTTWTIFTFAVYLNMLYESLGHCHIAWRFLIHCMQAVIVLWIVLIVRNSTMHVSPNLFHTELCE